MLYLVLSYIWESITLGPRLSRGEMIAILHSLRVGRVLNLGESLNYPFMTGNWGSDAELERLVCLNWGGIQRSALPVESSVQGAIPSDLSQWVLPCLGGGEPDLALWLVSTQGDVVAYDMPDRFVSFVSQSLYAILALESAIRRASHGYAVDLRAAWLLYWETQIAACERHMERCGLPPLALVDQSALVQALSSSAVSGCVLFDRGSVCCHPDVECVCHDGSFVSVWVIRATEWSWVLVWSVGELGFHLLG